MRKISERSAALPGAPCAAAPDAANSASHGTVSETLQDVSQDAVPDALPAVGAMPMPGYFPYKAVFLHGRPRHRKYDDFWIRHPPMDTGHRAKIFSPFAALKGFEECIGSKEVLYTVRRDLSEEECNMLDRKLALLHALTQNGPMARKNRPSAKVTYFEPCRDVCHFAYGSGGQYKTAEGTVSRVDTLISRSIILDGQKISLEDVSDIQILISPEDNCPIQ